jgi:MFS family permease
VHALRIARIAGLLGIGVFLSGLELLVTATALPTIVVDLADWTQLRAASWIVNGYLLVSIVAMPLAGRLCDLWGARRLFLGAMALFALGSALSGAAQSLDQLIAARLIQAVGGGALLPVATAAAAHLGGDRRRLQALGLVGSLTFLGMAAGPFVGAAILESLDPSAALAGIGLDEGPAAAILGDAWRFVFYLNVPIGIAAMAIGWASTDWDTPRRSGRIDLAGAAMVSLSLLTLLGGLTLAGGQAPIGPLDGTQASWLLVLVGLIVGAIAIGRAVRRTDPFLDVRLMAGPQLSSAVLVSLLTGYAFATAVVGGAVFVDRVLYGGPESQRLALGALALATALGALGAGALVPSGGRRLTALAGLALGTGGLVAAAGWSTATGIESVAGGLAVFGLGFGLVLTSRTEAAVEALGQGAYGVASAAVTVARMLGMAVGLAVLTAYGSTTIDRLWAAIYATPDAFRAVLPAELRDRPIQDGLVVEALEAWASTEAARVMVGVFLAAAAINAIAVVPAARLAGSRRILAPIGASTAEATAGTTGETSR